VPLPERKKITVRTGSVKVFKNNIIQTIFGPKSVNQQKRERIEEFHFFK
jgi:phosphotransferase system IIB component